MIKFLISSLVFLIPPALFASEIMTSARQLSLGRVSAVGYYTHNEQTIDFGSRGEHDLISDAFVGKFSVKVWDNWNLFVKVGMIGADIEKGSLKLQNEDNFDNVLLGFGVRYNLFPDTIVTPGISVDFSVTKYSQDLDVIDGSLPGASPPDQEIDSLEYQGTIYISKKFFALEPYGGFKILRNDVEWKDNDPLVLDRKIEGDVTGVSPFLGVKFNFLPLFSVTLEGSAMAEKAFSAGLTVGF